jgi:RNA polymerase sigma-70 factor (ECF subfamily)
MSDKIPLSKMADPTPKDMEMFVRLFTRSQLQVLGFIQVLVPSPNDAEDILQETGIKLWSKWSQYDSSRDFASWACGFARFEALRFLEKNKHKNFLSDSVLNELASLATAELEGRDEDERQQEALANCVERLKATDQELLYQRYQLNESVDVISRVANKSPRAIYKQLAVIRRALKQCIDHRLSYEAGL